MTIGEFIAKRDIREIVHFTTNAGVTGIFANRFLLSRTQLPKEKYLEEVYKYNCPNRDRDREWWDYVNLSISTVNRRLFGISMGNWHSKEDGWWCILGFSPEICLHDGVFFTTTNNIYTSVKRTKGLKGLNAMFAKQIERWRGNIVQRPSTFPADQPTCEYAEVLYPQRLSIKYLHTVYVETEEHQDKLETIKAMFDGLDHVNCEIRPELFS